MSRIMGVDISRIQYQVKVRGEEIPCSLRNEIVKCIVENAVCFPVTVEVWLNREETEEKRTKIEDKFPVLKRTYAKKFIHRPKFTLLFNPLECK